MEQLEKAFSVEVVTKDFFDDYKKVFRLVEETIRTSIPDAKPNDTAAEEKRRLFTQRLFNRLMFIYFLQKKGWLSFDGDTNYLRRLFDEAEKDAAARGETKPANFYPERLCWLFFSGLGVSENADLHHSKIMRERRGDVPYLNGGLFEKDGDGFDDEGKIVIENRFFGEILDLFELYNFTVDESTPVDVELAVDPEMLGKVFEELVTGRHESGSYYTPRQIVSFMCRESLKYYLAPFDTPETIAAFVDKGDGENLNNPDQILTALKQIRVCDPACGSGAYLLGTLQELLRLRQAVFASKKIGNEKIYDDKREIIENNIYGVDKDRFAVQIASLRLWLSLAIDSDIPKALPNLKYKIGCGDSLLAPLESDLQPDLHRQSLIERFRDGKAKYARAFDYAEKTRIIEEIKQLRVELARSFKHLPEPPKPQQIVLAEAELQPLKDKIQRLLNIQDKHQAEKYQKKLNGLQANLAEWKRQTVVDDYDTGEVFDWTVEFAEVFADGGFDVVLANPPYIRQELLGREYKESGLKPNFGEVYDGKADIYVYFFARANRMLKTGGVGCFISSNKWLRAGYGEKLRQHLLDATKFHLVVDFGELPVFRAATFPAIFLWQQAERNGTPTNWAVVKDLQLCYSEGVREHILGLSETLPSSQFGIGKARLASIHTTNFRETMERSGTRLGEILNGQLLNGVKTGFNKAFIINEEIKLKLISEDKNSGEIIKPMLAGDDIRRYEVHFRSNYLIYITWDFDISQFPAIFNWLTAFRPEIENRDGVRNNGSCPWFSLSRPRTETRKSFNSPKIIYPDIGTHSRFVMDEGGYFVEATTFLLPTDDWYLLGILNSESVFKYVKCHAAVLGDSEDGGRVRFKSIYLETLPIPNASDDERGVIGDLARATQNLHTKRRGVVERFLAEVGTSAAESSSRNVLESPWTLAEEDFLRRTRARYDVSIFRRAKDETAALTAEINRIEREIDLRVADLYGIKPEITSVS